MGARRAFVLKKSTGERFFPGAASAEVLSLAAAPANHSFATLVSSCDIDFS
jgi:hypothetical protein